MPIISCNCCRKNYEFNGELPQSDFARWKNLRSVYCPTCLDQIQIEHSWQESEEFWREQEEKMLETRGLLDNSTYEDEDDLDPDHASWLCGNCGDPAYDCGCEQCVHCGDALSHDQIGNTNCCHNCEYDMEHPPDEIEYDNYEQVYDPNFPF